MKDEATQAFLDIFLKCLEYETFIDLARDKKKREYFSFVYHIHIHSYPRSTIYHYHGVMKIGDELLWSNVIRCTSKSCGQTLIITIDSFASPLAILYAMFPSLVIYTKLYHIFSNPYISIHIRYIGMGASSLIGIYYSYSYSYSS